MSEHHSRPQEAFLTQPEDIYGSDPPSPRGTDGLALVHQLKALEQEKVDLESQEVELRQQLADLKNRATSNTGFAPLASIFPMQRDVFGETKSAGQQLKIYRREYKLFTNRYKRASDTTYAYELERLIERKKEKVRSLERIQVSLKASNAALERRLLRLKSDATTHNDVAQMTDLASHVTLLRDQVHTLEEAEAQNRELYAAAEEAMSRSKGRYHKMKMVAEQYNISLESPKVDTVRQTYDVFALRLERMQKRSFFKEDQRIKELRLEKARLESMAKDMKSALVDRDIDLSRKQLNITTLRKVGGASERISPKLHTSVTKFHLRKDVSLPLTNRGVEEEAE